MPTDITKAVAILEKEIATLAIKADKIVITSQAEQHLAGEMLSQINSYADKVKARKEEITKPMNAALKSARELFKPAETKAEIAIKALRTAMGAYQLAEENRIAEEEAKIAARVGKGKGHLKDETAVRKMDELDRPAAVVATASGLVKFRTDIKLEIVDYDAVMNHIAGARLMDLVELDESALLKWIKAGNAVSGAILKEVKTPINHR